MLLYRLYYDNKREAAGPYEAREHVARIGCMKRVKHNAWRKYLIYIICMSASKVKAGKISEEMSSQ